MFAFQEVTQEDIDKFFAAKTKSKRQSTEAKGKQEQGSQYNSMKTDLMEYLKTFAEEGKVSVD